MTDANVRFLVTLGLLAIFFALEALVPARKSSLTFPRISRQFGMAITSAIVARLALGGGLAGVALLAEVNGWGLFRLVTVPNWVAIGLSFLLLDFAIWVQHLALHRVPFLWRLHRVHHSDLAMDVTTALRFHPVEILASLGYKVIIVMALGAPPEAVLAFEIVLGAGALFTHANLALPLWLEQPLRLLLVTPSLHLIHHSPNTIETNSNFGFSFNLWDRLFGTYRAKPLNEHASIGLEGWREQSDQQLVAMMVNPFK